jgi:hypothetical protein
MFREGIASSRHDQKAPATDAAGDKKKTLY